MKFSCTQLALAKTLSTVSRAVSSRTTIPVLKGILLTVKNGKLFLTASDLDFSIETCIDVSGTEDGSAVVSAKLFEEIIRKLPNSIVKCETSEDEKLSISCLGSDFSIVTFPAADFPAIGAVAKLNAMEVKVSSFKDLVRKTAFAASIDEKKGVLTGCLLSFEEKKLELAALDGFRMAVASEETDLSEDKRIIVSARILNEITKILADAGEEEVLSLISDEKKIEIICGDTRMIVRLLEGEFIKYKDIIPASCKTRCILSREELLSSIERASLLAKEGKNNLIRMNVGNGKIEITSRSEEGNVREEVAAEIGGEELVIGFNAKYILDVLKALTDEEIALEMTNAVSACLIRPVEGDAYTYLILPVRISAA